MSSPILLCFPAALFLFTFSSSPPKAPRSYVWEIGKDDGRAGEFLYGPSGYDRYGRDGLFLVGRSEAGECWPYVLPGPADAWAGGKIHTFRVFFGLKDVPSGPWRLHVRFLDTHKRKPPLLVTVVNGREFSHQVPPGGGDASIQGRPGEGKKHDFTLEIPAGILRRGLNEIRVSARRGSWVVFDWLGLEGPEGAEGAPLEGVVITRLRPEARIVRAGGRPVQFLEVGLLSLGPPGPLVLEAEGAEPVVLRIPPGRNARAFLRLPPRVKAGDLLLTVKRDGRILAKRKIPVPAARPAEPVDWVDCLVGTSTSRWMLFPGPALPFGMVKLSPDNQRRCWKAGYEYTIENLAGFSHLHSWTMGGLLTMPASGPLKILPGPEDDPDAGYRSRFRHDTETAVPGYYAVTLEDYGIRAELTATTRAGFQRYSFPPSHDARILFDLLTPTEYGYSVLDARVRRVNDREIEGYAVEQGGRGAPFQRFTLHFVARTDRPFTSMGSWVNGRVSRKVEKAAGEGDVGVFLEFPMEKGGRILLQTGISLVSIAQARLNLVTEMKPFGWDFDACREAARKVWNDLLRKVEVEGGTPEDRVKFYTNFYRAYCSRTIWSDVNGKYVDMYEKVRKLPDPDSPVYGCDAFWNTFWNLNQLWNLVTPSVSEKWVRSLLEIRDRGGWLPKGPTGIEYSAIMVAEHGIPLIVAAWQAGIRGFEPKKALEAMVHCQTTPGGPHPAGGRVGNADLVPYLKYGYVPMGMGRASNTLEYAYDDWCVSRMALALGKMKLYEEFRKRGENWRNLFDPGTGFMRPRRSDGRRLEKFDPFSPKGGWVEGNPWQYTWFVPQNVGGLVKAMGRKRFVKRLDHGLRLSEKSGFNAPGDRFAQCPVNHGNQPSMHAAYLFDFAGAPWLTQKWVRAIMDEYYGSGPLDGWPGDEDQGQMGAWFVMSAMGIFQVDGGCRPDPVFEIGSPLFEKVTIHLDRKYFSGKAFVIEAGGNSRENVYIQDARLNGSPLQGPWIPAKEVWKGGRLLLVMGKRPNRALWGPESAPPEGEEKSRR